MMEFDTDNVKLIMRYKKILPSAQGMAIYGDSAFILHHTGECAIYNLKTKDPKPEVRFRLGSWNSGTPNEKYINHANQCMFSSRHLNGNPLPLLYVTTGNAGGGDENGYYYRCAVENINVERDSTDKAVWAKSERIQTISYRNDGIERVNWETPCWGCPAWFVDSENGSLYMFSARYRTTEAFLQYYDRNSYIITRFPLPDAADGGLVILTAKDIEDQFLAPFNILFTQGGMICRDKLFYTFGLGDAHYPIGLRVYDLKERCQAAAIDLSTSAMGAEEIESCSFYHGELLCNTNAETGGIFSLGRSIWDKFCADKTV